MQPLQTYGSTNEMHQTTSNQYQPIPVSVTTRVESQEVGVQLKYDRLGKLLSNAPATRQVGTTVRIERLFESVPVRRQELLRSLSKHFNKLMQVLYVCTRTHNLCTLHHAQSLTDECHTSPTTGICTDTHRRSNPYCKYHSQTKVCSTITAIWHTALSQPMLGVFVLTQNNQAAAQYHWKW
jgi:DNA mismatch repair ATPase MutL